MIGRTDKLTWADLLKIAVVLPLYAVLKAYDRYVHWHRYRGRCGPSCSYCHPFTWKKNRA